MKRWTASEIAAVLGGLVSLGSLIAGIALFPYRLAQGEERQSKLEREHADDIKAVNARIERDATSMQDVRERCIRIEESNKAILDRISDLRRFLPRAAVGNINEGDLIAGGGRTPQ